MRVNLFLGGRQVKTVYAKPVDNWDFIIKKDYKVTIIGHKDIFGKNKVTVFLRPVALLSDPTNKEVNLNCIIYGGANIE